MVDISDEKPLFCDECGSQLYSIDEIAEGLCNRCRHKAKQAEV